MAALFAGIVRAPLTGIVLIAEMTESYALMLPLVLSCFLAYLTADLLRDEPIYEALLERDLLRSKHRPELDSTVLIDLVVEDGAAFVRLNAMALIGMSAAAAQLGEEGRERLLARVGEDSAGTVRAHTDAGGFCYEIASTLATAAA